MSHRLSMMVPTLTMSDLGCKAQTMNFRNKIAIVQRGNCTFSTPFSTLVYGRPGAVAQPSSAAGIKVQNAQQAGARAVLVWNQLGDFYVYACSLWVQRMKWKRRQRVAATWQMTSCMAPLFPPLSCPERMCRRPAIPATFTGGMLIAGR